MVYSGDRNSKYFHGKANAHKKRNIIDALLTTNGEWLYDVESIKKEAFLMELFSETSLTNLLINCDVGYSAINHDAM